MNEKDNGGPAFPQFDVVAGERDGHGDAIEAYTTATGGMTLRDYYAGQAMSAFIRRAVNPDDWLRIAPVSFEMADAMIAARKGASQ